MSLLSNLETFLDTVGNVSDIKFMEMVNQFLENEKKPKALFQLKEAIAKWKYHNYTDEHIDTLVKEFIHTRNNPPTFDAQKFLTSTPYPDLQSFQNLTSEQLRLCLEFDKKQWIYREKIVHKIVEDAWDPQLIMWLINSGFEASEWDLFEICRREDFQLFKFYFERKIVDKVTNCHILPIIIEKNNMKFFKYVLENNLISEDKTLYAKKLIFDNAISECIKSNNSEMMTMLFTKDETYFKHIVVDTIYNSHTSYNVMRGVSKEMCLWFWVNDMKWSVKQAQLATNKFMLSFHE